jgi:pimeloyl-ACP methyl ester carboxylesterase
MRAGFELFRAFERDAADFAVLGERPFAMPVLVIAGERSGGEFLASQVRLVATDVQSRVVAASGHWLVEEAPDDVLPAIVAFVD